MDGNTYMNEENEFSLVERILQRVVAMLYDPVYLLILVEIQQSKNFITVESVSQSTHIPVKKVNECIHTFSLENILEQHQNPQGTSKNSKVGYVINYRTVVEWVVYKYHMIKIKNCDRNVDEKVFYYCAHDKARYSYEEAMNYFYDGSFECPDCGRELVMMKESNGVGMPKTHDFSHQLLALRNDLERLRDEYTDIKDYPVMKPPELPQSVQDNKSGAAMGRRTSRDNVDGRAQRIYSNLPMPWEEDEIEAKEKEIVFGSEEKEFDIKDIDFSLYVFLQPNKTFEDKREIILGSTETSPLRNEEIIRPILKAKKRPMRALSATPQFM